MQTPVIHIAIDADGHPRTINRHVKVHMIAKKHRAGATPESLAEHYEITLADVYAALAYYHDNQAYFDEREQQTAPLIEAGQQTSDALRETIEQRLHTSDDNS